ncbi:CHASE2 domain-containing protein [uncultured Phenylobacterium sp.]|uniref:CHASE2 domain-containing protein n=1 Tax=uncultured Phenylobacterium sp. TaxID=349273 RepID=UPI0025D43C96|nr:CHASE2 domain-containing protein [uncultured Phenylobacterium sp.]
MDPAARRRVRIGGLIAAILTSLFLSAVVLAPPIGSLRTLGAPAAPGERTPPLPASQWLFDLFQRVSTGRVSPQVQIVEIDEQTLATFGAWPWSRFDVAALVAKIAEQNPAAIGFDLMFPERDRLNAEFLAEYYPQLPPSALEPFRSEEDGADSALGRTLGKTPSVLARLGTYGEGQNTPLPPLARFEGVAPPTTPVYPTVIANVPTLENRAAGHGLVNGEKGRDGVVRNIPLLGRAGGYLTPSLALELVRIAEGEPPIRLEGDASRIHAIAIGKHRVRTMPGGQMRLRFRDVMEDQITSPVDIAEGRVPANQFTGKIVLIGLTSAGTTDVVATPRNTAIYGVFVQAQAIDAILNSRALVRPPWAVGAEWIAGLAIVLAACAFLPRLRLRAIAALAAAINAAALGGSWLAFQGGLLVDPAPVVAPAFVAAMTMISLLFVEGGRIRNRLRSSLEAERHEREAASQIQEGMLIPRARLAAISPIADVDAVLLPARSVGGDLYDVFALPAGRLCFLVGDVTGKGLPASLFMALGKALSRSLLTQPHLDLAQAVGAINNELNAGNGQSMQMSLLVGILHADGRLEMCSAGHEDPFVMNPAGEVRSLQLDGGPPLCAMDDFPYPLETFRLEPGETLVAFTDGVTEAQDRGQALFGARRAAVGIAAAVGRPISELVDTLVAEVRAFEAGAEPSDDLTVLALRRPAP